MSRWPGRLITKTPVAPGGASAFDSAPGVWTIPEVAYWTKQGLWPNAANVGDPYFKYVSYLLGTTATNAAQNNTFLDSSTNNFTITRNGNATQGAFSPYGVRWSNYFDGAGDYLASSGGAASAMGTGDFSCEAFVYWTSYPTQYTSIFSTRSTNNANAAAFTVGVESSGYVYAFSSAFIAQTASGVFALNTWNHVVFTRSGTTARLFVNGVLRATGTNSQNFTDQGFAVGANRDGTEPGAGYVSNVRLVKGAIPPEYQTSSTSVGATIFMPPTSPLTAISGTSLLTCQSNRFRDASSNNFAITANGNTAAIAFNPFGQPAPGYSTATYGGSAYLDGSGDYLTAPANSAWAFGTGDFTVECWVNFNSGSSNARISNRLPGGGASGTWGFNMGPNFFSFSEVVAGEPGVTASGLPSMTGAWTHLAACRSGSTLNLFANGVLVGSGTNTTNFNNTSYSLVIGATYETSMAGYISNVRIVKGTALYTAAFTPPTSPVTAVSGTSILCNFANAGIYDASMNCDMETVGNAQVSSVQVKFGATSLYLDGTGDYVVTPATISFGYGGSNFTIEFWMFLTGTQDQTIISNLTSASSINPHIYYSAGTIRYYTASADRIVSPSISTGQWYHVAICRASGSTKMFVNGNQAGSTYADSNNYGLSAPLGVGTYWSGGSPVATNTFTGYLDDLRITNGYARYITNFTPPSSAFFQF